MTVIVNFFAGPGAGKSTTAAGVFHALKKMGKSAELVTEYAKERVWEEHLSVFTDQVYLTAKQNHRLHRLNGKVDYVVTDSPLLLGQYYVNSCDALMVHDLTERLFSKYFNVNIFINRTKPLVQQGRNENEAEARRADQGILNSLQGRPYSILEDDDDIIQNVLDIIGVKP